MEVLALTIVSPNGKFFWSPGLLAGLDLAA